MTMFRSGLAGLLLAPLFLATALADEVSTVEVSGLRNPELKPYRVMLAGLDAFDEYHELAPKASEVRFKLRNSANDNATFENVTLGIAGADNSVPVPLSADGLFSLPRNAALADENADLVLNQRKGHYRWEAEVRSEGLPPDVRRLGDLRLECEVTVAVAKKEIGFWMHTTVTSLLLTNHWCGSTYLNWISRSARPLRQATLVAGEQRVALKLGDKGMNFTAPTSDTSYPDDALIELDYTDPAQKEE